MIEDTQANSIPRQKGEGEDEKPPNPPAPSRVPARYKAVYQTPEKKSGQPGRQTIDLDLKSGI